MPTLLCTLGTSWAVVPEAFLLGNGETRYNKVVVLTTSGDLTATALANVESWFNQHAPEVEVISLAIAYLPDLNSADDHSRFEEALFRAYFAQLKTGDEMHVCLAGGYKTMSAATQEAAGLLGCAKLFHITARFGTATHTHEEIVAAIDAGDVRLIPLGSRSGWPTILELSHHAPPLPTPNEPFLVEEFALSNAVHHRIEAANRLASSEKDLAILPFSQLARWAPGERAALHEPLNPDPCGADAAWLLALPKVDLHCHLGGFATSGPLLDEVRASAAQPEHLSACPEIALPEGWPLPDQPIGLETYRKLGDASGSKLLRDPGCLRQHIELMYAHFQQQNLIYAEIRCSPANYTSQGRSAWDILTEIRQTFQRCRDQALDAKRTAPWVNLIIIATRQSGGDFRTAISRHLSLAATAFEHWTDEAAPRVVGVDLAGFEDKATRAHYFRDDFMAALRLGMGITVHAGENDDAEGIWSAILDLNARRLGHALHLRSSESLLRTVADRRIGIEMCPYANLQIVGFPLGGTSRSTHPSPTQHDELSPRIAEPYPLLDYLRAGVAVTVNTDNIGISSANLTENFLLLPRLCPGITRLDVLQLLRNAMEQAFIPTHSRQALLASIHIPLPR